MLYRCRLCKDDSANDNPYISDFLISRCWLELRQIMKRYWRMKADPKNNPTGLKTLEQMTGGAVREVQSEAAWSNPQLRADMSPTDLEDQVKSA